MNAYINENEPKPKLNIILTSCLYLLMMAYAFSLTMIGPIIPVLIQHYGLKLSQGGLIVALQNFGGVLAIVLGGIISDVVRKSILVVIIFAVYSLSLFLIGLSPSIVVLFIIFFILGASTRMLDTVINGYIADLHIYRRGLFINLLHTSFGIGALIGPLYSRILLDSNMGWHQSFYLLGIICTIILLLYIFVLKYAPKEENKTVKIVFKGYMKMIKDSKIWVLSLIGFMYAGHRSVITTWLPMYMEYSLKADLMLSSAAVSVFWAGVTIGRLICSYLSIHINTKYIILWGSLSGGAVLFIGIAAMNPVILTIAFGAAGLLAGSALPLVTTIACDLYPGNSGTAYSVILFNYTLSMIAFPWFTGVIADKISFHLAIAMSAAALIAIFVLSFLICAPNRAVEKN